MTASSTKVVLDKRLRVDIAAFRELSDTGTVSLRWIEGKLQLADILTKKGCSTQPLVDLLATGQLPSALY